MAPAQESHQSKSVVPVATREGQELSNVTQNETGSWAGLSRSGKVLFIAAREQIAATERSQPRGCQQSAGDA